MPSGNSAGELRPRSHCSLNSTPPHRTHFPAQPAHRYLISTDGLSCSNRLDKLLVLGSVVMKQEGPRYGWYYDAIKPYKHYVPFFVNSSDDILEVGRGCCWALPDLG